MNRILLMVIVLIQITAAQPHVRIVSTSSEITQTIVALGMESNLVGIDSTSNLTATLRKLPNLGFRLRLSTEGILSLKPDIIFLANDSGSAQTIEQIKRAKIPIVTLQRPTNLTSIIDHIEQLSHSLNRSVEGQALIKEVTDAHARFAHKLATRKLMVNAMFLFEDLTGGAIQAFAGGETNANQLINLLGFTNIFEHDFVNYKMVNLETQLQKKPDLVLIGNRKTYGVDDARFTVRSLNAFQWPNGYTPKCAIEVDISYYLVFSIHIYSLAEALYDAIDGCMSATSH